MTEKAVFAMGCFWGPQLKFSKIPGVIKTEVGYTGGSKDIKNPNYKEVCSDTTGHAEAVEVTFDPKKISYEELLKNFWENHGPTQYNMQGPDIGSQYRSAIFYLNDKQKKIAEKNLKEAQKKHKKEIVTEIKKLEKFWPAEEYHQNYLKKRGLNTC